jgi:hypothetical protein
VYFVRFIAYRDKKVVVFVRFRAPASGPVHACIHVHARLRELQTMTMLESSSK